MDEVRERLVRYIVDNQNKFYKIAYCYVRNKEDALDIVQNAICVALEKLHTLKNPDAIATWFYRILVNESINLIRRNEKEIPREDVEDGLDEGVILINQGKGGFHKESGFEGMDVFEGNELMEALESLPKETQTIIYLYYFEGIKLKDIAVITDTNENTVKSRLYSGLDKLKKNMMEA